MQVHNIISDSELWPGVKLVFSLDSAFITIYISSHCLQSSMDSNLSQSVMIFLAEVWSYMYVCLFVFVFSSGRQLLFPFPSLSTGPYRPIFTPIVIVSRLKYFMPLYERVLQLKRPTYGVNQGVQLNVFTS